MSISSSKPLHQSGSKCTKYEAVVCFYTVFKYKIKVQLLISGQFYFIEKLLLFYYTIIRAFFTVNKAHFLVPLIHLDLAEKRALTLSGGRRSGVKLWWASVIHSSKVLIKVAQVALRREAWRKREKIIIICDCNCISHI